jgi:hypothetical protein
VAQYYEVNQKSKNFVLHYSTSRKPVRCTGKLLKIKSKLILILLLLLLNFIIFFFFFFFVVQNVVGKIDKDTLRIGFRIDSTFWFKKITKKVFTIG